MNDYFEVRVDLDPCTEDATDLLAAMLGEVGYESFVPDEKGVTAYIKAEDYSGDAVRAVLAEFPFECKAGFIAALVPGQDWNAEWEKHYFKPIVVGGEEGVAIYSSFHTDVPKAKYGIVIDPKMAFGTGHHATTSLMLTELLSMDLAGKTVIDMGTGTGILAILSAMRGATDVLGIEIDPFAYENALDNAKTNGHEEIKFVLGDASALAEAKPADVFIANINRNIITGDIAAYAERLKDDGVMLLSGFYEHDIPVILEAAAPLGLTEVSHATMGDNWALLKLKKQ